MKLFFGWFRLHKNIISGTQTATSSNRDFFFHTACNSLTEHEKKNFRCVIILGDEQKDSKNSVFEGALITGSLLILAEKILFDLQSDQL